MSNVMAVIIWFVLVWLCASTGAAEPWPFDVTDLRSRDRLIILVFGDGGTGEAGQYRVGQAMYQVCAERRCDLGLVLGDNLYDDGVKVTERSNADASYREIMRQFDEKFEGAYRPFEQLDGFMLLARPRKSRLPEGRRRRVGHLLGIQPALADARLSLRRSALAGLDPDLRARYRYG